MITIKLNKYYVVKVDDEDYDKLIKYKWYCAQRRDGEYMYAARGHYGKHCKLILMHRVIMDIPSGLVVDHIDHDGLNNQKSNLRKRVKAKRPILMIVIQKKE